MAPHQQSAAAGKWCCSSCRDGLQPLLLRRFLVFVMFEFVFNKINVLVWKVALRFAERSFRCVRLNLKSTNMLGIRALRNGTCRDVSQL